MVKTVVGNNIEKEFVGYMLNAPLSKENQQKIFVVQKRLSEKFGEAIWNAPPASLHITLFDWIAPLVEYREDKDVLFNKIFDEYDKVISESLKKCKTITVTFNNVKAAPAAIFIEGKDDGQFDQIRKDFVNRVELLPNTKLPPTIIHSTIGRFVEEIDLEPLQDFLSGLDFYLTQEITSFRLVREQIDPMLDFKVIKDYPLGL